MGKTETAMKSSIMRPKNGNARADSNDESGMGLPHSKTSRMEWRAIGRDSVLERGSPMPL